VKFQNPQDLQVLTTTLTVTEALKQERLSKPSIRSSTGRLGFKNGRKTGNTHRHSPKLAANQLRPRNYARGADRSGTSSSTRDVQHRSKPRCYECEGRGHLARKYPTRQKRERYRTCPVGKIRVNVRTVHARPTMNPVTQEKREQTMTPEIREMSER
jgi:hypothetical protein